MCCTFFEVYTFVIANIFPVLARTYTNPWRDSHCDHAPIVEALAEVPFPDRPPRAVQQRQQFESPSSPALPTICAIPERGGLAESFALETLVEKAADSNE